MFRFQTVILFVALTVMFPRLAVAQVNCDYYVPDIITFMSGDYVQPSVSVRAYLRNPDTNCPGLGMGTGMGMNASCSQAVLGRPVGIGMHTISQATPATCQFTFTTQVLTTMTCIPGTFVVQCMIDITNGLPVELMEFNITAESEEE